MPKAAESEKNYFKKNRPSVVRIPVDAGTLSGHLGVSVQGEVEVPILTDALDVVTGEDVAQDGSELHWVEYTVPGTQHTKRVEKMVLGDGSATDDKKVGGTFKKG